jgi:hypothetical protein
VEVGFRAGSRLLVAEADNPAAVVGSRVVAAVDIPAVADSRVEQEDSRAVGEDNNRPVEADNPVVEEDNRAVAGDSNRPVVAARRRMSYRTGRRMYCPG